MSIALHEPELVAVADLKPHPDNYREHPPDQRAHLVRSIIEHGVYRNVVVALDGTILAGHGVVEAAREAGVETITVVRLALAPDDAQALKILAGDNEVMRLAMTDDRALSELLLHIRDSTIEGLLGTGYDDAMLANLIYVTRPEGEVASRDDANAWVGLPAFEGQPDTVRLIISFESEAERTQLLAKLGIESVHQRNRGVFSVWWPPREREDASSLEFEVEQ